MFQEQERKGKGYASSGSRRDDGHLGRLARLRERTGKPFRFYRAYLLIGRGPVEHDPLTHEECETMFEKALRTPLLKRFQFWLDGVTARNA